VAVPGCGRGHDARFLAGRGYDVVGYDFSTAAVSAARALARRDGVAVTFEQRDIFTLARDEAHGFDGVWEYTCYCAIDPARRDEYVRTMAAILRPGGWLLGCFFPLRVVTAGPPFPVSRAELRRRFAGAFRFERAQPPLRSARGRQGREWLVYARRV
jgi:SAM-dependent methyltransferase